MATSDFPDAELPITRFTSLEIKSPNPESNLDVQGGFYVAKMTTVQRKELLKITNGTIVYDTDLKAFYFYQDDAWQPMLNSENVLAVTAVGDIKKGQIPVFSADGSSVVITENSKDQDNKNVPIILGAMDLPDLQKLKASKNKDKEQNKEQGHFGSVVGLTGVEIIDFNDVGCISVDKQPYILFNSSPLDANTTQQNVLISDSATDPYPTTYDALLEIKSTSKVGGGLLLPRNSSVQIKNLPNPAAGMTVYDKTNNLLMLNTNGSSEGWRNVTTGMRTEIFKAVKTHTWVVPTGVNSAKITLVGGGGGGVRPPIYGKTNVCSGGGAAATTIAYITGLANKLVTIRIGAGGISDTISESKIPATSTTFRCSELNLQIEAFPGDFGGYSIDLDNAFYIAGGSGAIASPQPDNKNILEYVSIAGENGGDGYQIIAGDKNITLSGKGGNSSLGGAAIGRCGRGNGFGSGINAAVSSGSGGGGALRASDYSPENYVGGTGGSGLCIVEY